MQKKLASYQVIARKYRPKTLQEVVDQIAVVTTFKNALRMKRVAHAYLFCGCRGTGKTTLARLFAKALNCTAPHSDSEPCNTCSSCREIDEGSSLDVIEIDGASNRGIDDIRQINETVGYAPAASSYKIYIIDEVHMLTKEAFNALLKTLEEPPSHVKFFFATTEPHKVLPTILSRCQRFDLNRISSEGITSKLQKIAVDFDVTCEPDVFSLIASLSEGSMRDAESLLDQVLCCTDPPVTLAKASTALGIVSRSSLLALDKAFDTQNAPFAFELAADIFSSGKEFSYFLDLLLEHFRLHLKLKFHQPISLPSSQLKEQYLSNNYFYSEEQCLYILDFLIKTEQTTPKSSFKRVHLETVLLHIIRSKSRLSLPALIKRLEQLEKTISAPSSEKIPVPLKQEPIEQKSIPLPTSQHPPAQPLQPISVVSEEKIPLPVKPITVVRKEQPSVPVKPIAVTPEEKRAEKQSNCHYDTLVRFAAVELEGVLRKE